MPPKKVYVNLPPVSEQGLPLEAKVASKTTSKDRTSNWAVTAGAANVGTKNLTLDNGSTVGIQARDEDNARIFRNNARLPVYGNQYFISVSKPNATSSFGTTKTAKVGETGEEGATKLELQAWRKVYFGLMAQPHVMPWISDLTAKVQKLFDPAYIEVVGPADSAIVQLNNDSPCIESTRVEPMAVAAQPKPTVAPMQHRWMRIVLVDYILSGKLNNVARSFKDVAAPDGKLLIKEGTDWFIGQDLGPDPSPNAPRYGIDPVPAIVKVFPPGGAPDRANPIGLVFSRFETLAADDLTIVRASDTNYTLTFASVKATAMLDAILAAPAGKLITLTINVKGKKPTDEPTPKTINLKGDDAVRGAGPAGRWKFTLEGKVNPVYPYARGLLKDPATFTVASIAADTSKFSLTLPNDFEVAVVGDKRRGLKIKLLHVGAKAAMTDAFDTHPGQNKVSIDFWDTHGDLVAGESDQANIVIAVGAVRASVERAVPGKGDARIADVTARVVAHEINHAIGGVVAKTDGDALAHGGMYEEAEGGGASKGTGHCKHNAVLKLKAELESDEKYKGWVEAGKPKVWVPNGTPCIMHHKIDPRTFHNNTFCEACIKQMKSFDLAVGANLVKWSTVR